MTDTVAVTRTSERRSSGRASIAASRAFMPISGVLAGVLLSRQLGTEGRGVIAAAIVYAEVAPAIFAAGLGAAARSLVARRDLSPDVALTAALRTAQPWVFFVAPLAIVVFGIVGPVALDSRVGLAVILLFGTTIATAIRIVIEGATGATGAYGLHAAIAFSMNLAPLLVIAMLALTNHLTVAGALLAYSAGYVLAAAIAALGAPSTGPRSDTPNLDLRAATLTIRSEWRGIAPSQILDLLNRRLDILLVVILATDSAIGIFAVAASAARLPGLVAQISTITTSTARRDLDEGEASADGTHLRNTARFLAVAAVVIGIVGWVLIPRVYGEAFRGAVPLLAPLLIGTCAMTLAQVASVVLLIDDRARLVTSAQATGVALTLIAVPVGYLGFGLVGAAAGSTIGYLATAAITLSAWRREPS